MRTHFRHAACAAALLLAVAGPVSAEETAVPDVTSLGVMNLPPTKKPLELLRGRLVLLTFMNAWSDRCVDALPHLSKLESELSGRGLTILAVFEGSPEQIAPWVEKNAVTFPVAALDTLGNESLRNAFTVPGDPHAVLISPDGQVLAAGHPQSMKKPSFEPHLTGIRTPPPRLPAALADEQKLFEDGRWGAARAALAAKGDALDKVSAVWARGLVEWVELRRKSWLEEAAALDRGGRHWDAWDMYTDYARRFEGMEAQEEAAAAAAAIRANPEAAKDLAAGDDVAKARGLLAEGKTRPAHLILQRVLKQGKGSLHAERAKALLDGAK